MRSKRIIVLMLSVLMLCLATPALAFKTEEITDPPIETIKFVI